MTSSISIRRELGTENVDLIARAQLTPGPDGWCYLFRALDGREAIETNGDAVFEGDNGFHELRAEIMENQV